MLHSYSDLCSSSAICCAICAICILSQYPLCDSRQVTNSDSVLVADVTYDNEGYMIEAVKEGSTLFNKDGTAHRKVNSWTANLTVTIREEENKILLRQTN